MSINSKSRIPNLTRSSFRLILSVLAAVYLFVVSVVLFSSYPLASEGHELIALTSDSLLNNNGK